jgi:hypothetical protein
VVEPEAAKRAGGARKGAGRKKSKRGRSTTKKTLKKKIGNVASSNNHTPRLVQKTLSQEFSPAVAKETTGEPVPRRILNYDDGRHNHKEKVFTRLAAEGGDEALKTAKTPILVPAGVSERRSKLRRLDCNVEKGSIAGTEESSNGSENGMVRELAVPVPPVPFPNLGNTCYINSVLQCLRVSMVITGSLAHNIKESELAGMVRSMMGAIDLDVSGRVAHPDRGRIRDKLLKVCELVPLSHNHHLSQLQTNLPVSHNHVSQLQTNLPWCVPTHHHFVFHTTGLVEPLDAPGGTRMPTRTACSYSMFTGTARRVYFQGNFSGPSEMHSL